MEIIAIPLIIFLLMIFVTSFFFTMKKRLVGCLMLIILIAGSAALGYMLITGVITLPEGTEMCMPGDNVTMDVELITPIAIEEGLRFAIREGGRTVGSGVVSKINE